MSDDLSINCWIIGDKPSYKHVFQIQIPKSDTVRALKYAIGREKEFILQYANPDSLVLWKVSIPFAGLDANVMRYVERPSEVDYSRGLPSMDTISEHFPSPASEHIHVIVCPPHADSSVGQANTTKWGTGVATPVSIVAGMFGIVVVALLHHFFDAYLDGKDVHGSFWSQTMTRRVENALATVFKVLFAASAGVSLCQVVSNIL
jgi:hypothetical protein